VDVTNLKKFFTPTVIKRPDGVEQGEYGEVVKYKAHLTVPARIRQLSGAEVQVGGNDVPVKTHRMYCEPCDIKEPDIVEKHGKIYEVTNVNDVMNFGVLYHVELKTIATSIMPEEPEGAPEA
jgi:hypothetical protein